MNLHGIVRAAIGAVNPHIPAILRRSAGNTTDASFKQVPAYEDPVEIRVQVQALTAKELAQVDSLNIQGVMRGVYLDGDWQGVARADGRGGDLIEFEGRTWLVVQVLETWPDWAKVAVCQQTSA